MSAARKLAQNTASSAQLQLTAEEKAAQAPPAESEVQRYCPVCSTRLEPHRCKLRCTVCGYYMSCADYY